MVKPVGTKSKLWPNFFSGSPPEWRGSRSTVWRTLSNLGDARIVRTLLHGSPILILDQCHNAKNVKAIKRRPGNRWQVSKQTINVLMLQHHGSFKCKCFISIITFHCEIYVQNSSSIVTCPPGKGKIIFRRKPKDPSHWLKYPKLNWCMLYS